MAAIDDLGHAIQTQIPTTKGYELCVCPGKPQDLHELSRQLVSEEVQMSEKIKRVIGKLGLKKCEAK